jgi:formate hydrogenlyase subunit 6/NADH:ubiquinone oxidoreductase subunit I
MAHQTLKSAYDRLTDRLNKFPQGAPPSELLHSILRLLFSEKEADLVALLPIKPFSARRAAQVWKVTETEARTTLDTLAGRAVLLDYQDKDGETRYMLPPPMAGFFEFSMMRVRGDVDQKTLAELFHRYVTVEGDFSRELFATGETQLGRAFVQEKALEGEESLRVLDYERATEVIKTATHIGIAMCYCRHVRSHQGTACDAPMDICMTFNTCADALIRHGFVRQVDAVECLDLLQQAQEHNLVQFGENNQRNVSFICNCCGCCCEAMLAVQRFGLMRPVHTTNFLPEVDAERCTACGRCVNLCPVGAASLVSAHNPGNRNHKVAQIDERYCLGCGVCVRPCARAAIRLKPRKERVITPVSSVHRAVLMATERGKLQNLLFDNQAYASHHAMAAVLGAILKLPPVRRAMAQKQMNSRYLDALLSMQK